MICDDFNGNRMDEANDVCRFRNDARDRCESVDIEMLEGLEVCLNACARRTVRAGNGEGYGWLVHGVSIAGGGKGCKSDSCLAADR